LEEERQLKWKIEQLSTAAQPYQSLSLFKTKWQGTDKGEVVGVIDFGLFLYMTTNLFNQTAVRVVGEVGGVEIEVAAAVVVGHHLLIHSMLYGIATLSASSDSPPVTEIWSSLPDGVSS